MEGTGTQLFGMRTGWDEEVLGQTGSLLEPGWEATSGTLVQSVGLQSVGLTCVAHEVVIWSVEEAVEATRVIPWARVTAELVFRRWVGVTAEVSGLIGGLCLHAGVAARLDFRDASEDVVEAQAVPNLMDHGVGVPRDAVERWIQDDAACQGEVRVLGELGTLLPAAGVPRPLKRKRGMARSNHSLLHPMTPQLRAVLTCGMNH